MIIKIVTPQDKKKFNKIVSHPLQSWEWGEFREKTGLKVIRRGIFQDDKLVGGFQLTIHPIPYTPWTIGYLPKGEMPDKEVIEELYKIGKQEKCIFIQFEPKVTKVQRSKIKDQNLTENSKIILQPAAHPLFTKY